MLHPSYNELMKAVNENAGGTEESPVVSSRYSIVIAAAKRARQLITEENLANEAEEEGRDTRPEKAGKAEKPLSVAIRELMDGDVKIVPNEDDLDDDGDMMFGADPMSNVIYTTDDDEESEEEGDEDAGYDSDLDEELDADDDDMDADSDDEDDDSLKLSEDELD